MLQTIRKLKSLLTARERRNTVAILAMMLLLGPFEAAGLASVALILAVLVKPSVVHSNTLLETVYHRLHFSDVNAFLFFLVAIVFVLVVSRIFFTALSQYALVRYASGVKYSISTRLLETYLHKPYAWFLNRHSAELGKSFLSEVDEVVDGSLLPAIQLVSNTIAALSLIAVLVAASPVVAASVIFVLCVAYAAVYFGVRNYVRRLGRDRFNANRERYQIAAEVLAGIKEVKVSGLEAAYLQRFRAPSHRIARRRAAAALVTQTPRNVFELIASGGLLIIVMALLRDDISRVVPILGLYAFAGLRLLPALQQIYQILTRFGFSQRALDSLCNELASPSPPKGRLHSRNALSIPLRQQLELRDVTYTYPQASRPALSDVSLSIAARTTIGFVGATGVGKTTLVDVILGLLEPQRGEVLVDGTPICRDNLRAWQRTIGYVPQQIFLADDTVAGNIAFGVPPPNIDMKAVEKAAECAELHSFVLEGLPHGYQTEIGERGIRLSGGQRQRVGIARALYHDPDLLIFDEATSALDNLTERAVMDALHNLAHVKTILVIAHRLSTVRSCDQIFLLDWGRLKATGTFEELLTRDIGFQKLAASVE